MECIEQALESEWHKSHMYLDAYMVFFISI